ncbi:MAG: type II secretion system minor pseudopilin GspK [Zoogloea sp.]|uniref:type II secretion system minor pseudopilin GspK n=1 Tax=Zoogloea sp. TaxID=49181 RepID=UPI0026343D79|nr:type II secretion system minor pseudopilin GspK [Zoogloea sp.]MDD2987382.1 type II secretion system minor pseudopilin GspK [Zoogloea sp.]
MAIRRMRPPAAAGPQKGAAVILALLTVALVAGIAAAAVGDLGVAMDQVIGRHDQAQARQLARGAVDWARNVLAEDASRSNVDHLGEAWAVKVPPTPVEEGEVSGELQDLSSRINLNKLVRIDGQDPLERDQFLRLLELVGVGKSEAMDLANALTDWLDRDDTPTLPGGAESSWYGTQQPPRSPANGPLASVGELAQVRGFTPALVARLSPFVAALPGSDSMINVNTAPPEVLAAAIADLPLDTARIMAVERNRAWFTSVASVDAWLKDRELPANTTSLDVQSRHFLATGRARFGVSMVRMEVLLYRPTGQKWSTIVWQKLL